MTSTTAERWVITDTRYGLAIVDRRTGRVTDWVRPGEVERAEAEKRVAKLNAKEQGHA